MPRISGEEETNEPGTCLIKGVVAFPNPNGNREIRFIDAFYHDLFKIPDHSNIVISYLDGGKRCVPCEYIDDTKNVAINSPWKNGNLTECKMSISERCHRITMNFVRYFFKIVVTYQRAGPSIYMTGRSET